MRRHDDRLVDAAQDVDVGERRVGAEPFEGGEGGGGGTDAGVTHADDRRHARGERREERENAVHRASPADRYIPTYSNYFNLHIQWRWPGLQH